MSESQFNFYMLDIMKQLNRCSDIEQFISVIDFEIKKMGFLNFNLFILPIISSLEQITVSPMMISSVHRQFASWYTNNNAFKSDELLDSVLKKRFPLLVSDYFNQQNASSKCRNLYEEINSLWGVKNGVLLSSERINFLLVINLHFETGDKQESCYFINNKLSVANYFLDILHIAIDQSRFFNRVEIIRPILPKISSRQLECLRLIASGLSQTQIAPEMHISIDTVKYHKKEILRIFNTSSMYSAIYKAVKSGLIP